ncbi:hypothetical protein DICVIV_09693 [Dictyocaulus viviparus]|uniref:Uncharacterized protein n=1 Tax=Dictyocaulus viviparus TaxID=29172 RepID=A0A0D8XHZ6_DICVI|nr:hypothetical protein DICVIV_09693 [Dictyocaulus viviparus]
MSLKRPQPSCLPNNFSGFKQISIVIDFPEEGQYEISKHSLLMSLTESKKYPSQLIKLQFDTVV